MAPKVDEEYREEKKSTLLNAAKKVFIKNGYINTTMQDIMDEANVSRGTLYNYFDNIDHIFIEVLKLDDQDNIDLFLDERPLWPAIKRWIEGWQIQIEEVDHSLLVARAEFFISSKFVKNKGNFPYISERYERTASAIEKAIYKGVERGEFQLQLPPALIARYLISFINGLMLDTFQLGNANTKVKEQLSVLLFSLEQMMKPTKKE
ncbi:TetR family transcriptional regulator [Bacillus sonorensis]|uniref:Transcriptional regulator n=2 Tax=Bacillus sonorensis TaxID=119858 RepID=M5NZN4_9BACI|nr:MULTISPECIES: TetR family transcriptional regulator [Bacillus]TWK78705.1 putative HTH-type transcriptional regulator YfiR [Bacillus paralicheniformis]ASB91330.1 putative HTH-type transcriptional regulator YfiR [Bacillus sonorensis]EME72633.1 transcriptional regulator [Bacillus sonorensis L12]MBG9917333.1 TetR family transcriptional regulator [Bacillus sonorensis]MCF7620099.1 TetR family transcriptional regulator [Bacillus sonorensis]